MNSNTRFLLVGLALGATVVAGTSYLWHKKPWAKKAQATDSSSVDPATDTEELWVTPSKPVESTPTVKYGALKKNTSAAPTPTEVFNRPIPSPSQTPAAKPIFQTPIEPTTPQAFTPVPLYGDLPQGDPPMSGKPDMEIPKDPYKTQAKARLEASETNVPLSTAIQRAVFNKDELRVERLQEVQHYLQQVFQVFSFQFGTGRAEPKLFDLCELIGKDNDRIMQRIQKQTNEIAALLRQGNKTYIKVDLTLPGDTDVACTRKFTLKHINKARDEASREVNLMVTNIKGLMQGDLPNTIFYLMKGHQALTKVLAVTPDHHNLEIDTYRPYCDFSHYPAYQKYLQSKLDPMSSTSMPTTGFL